MSLTELERLKRTLADIDKIRKSIPDISKDIIRLEKIKSEIEREIKGRKKTLGETENLKFGHDEWLNDVNEKIQYNLKWQKRREAQVEKFNEEQKPLMKKDENDILTLENTTHGMFIMVLAVTTLVFLALIGSIQGYQAASDLPRGEWVCDNGEIIGLLDVQDGIEDCSDGSDEEEYVFSDSRSEDARDSDEYGELSDAQWGTFFTKAGGKALPGLVFVGIAIVYYSLRNKPLQAKIVKLKEGLKDRSKKEKSLKDNVKSWKRKTSTLRKSIKEKENKITSIENQKLEIRKSQNKLENTVSEIDMAKLYIEKSEEKEVELWESIRDIIPFGNTSFDSL